MSVRPRRDAAAQRTAAGKRWKSTTSWFFLATVVVSLTIVAGPAVAKAPSGPSCGKRKPCDTAPPTVAISVPSSGSTATGTVTAWHLGGLVYLPTFAIGQWMKKYLNKTATGGEELPADGVGTLVRAIQNGGSTDRRRMIDTIETMGRFKFASVEFGTIGCVIP